MFLAQKATKKGRLKLSTQNTKNKNKENFLYKQL